VAKREMSGKTRNEWQKNTGKKEFWSIDLIFYLIKSNYKGI
jgi:hypothetical protein